MRRGLGKLSLAAAIAVALGLALRLWFLAHAAVIAGDTLIYGDIARTLLQHGVYGFSSDPVPTPTLIRLPGYPLFLALCFRLFGLEHYTAVILVQIALDLLGCLLLAALARRIFSTRVALAALFLAALCPFTASYVASPLTETLALLSMAIVFYALHRWLNASAARPWNLWLWALSLALGYSILLRPDQGLLAAAVLPAMLWFRSAHPSRLSLRPALPVVAAALCTLLPLVPWTIRNWHTFHLFQPLAPRYATDPGEQIPLGFQRWFRSWGIDFTSTEDVYWKYDGATIQISDLPNRAFDSPEQYAETEALLDDYNLTTNPSPALDARFNAIARQRIAANPLRYYVALPVARLLDMLLRPRTEMLPISLAWWQWQDHPGSSAFAVVYAALNLAWLTAGLAGLWRWDRHSAGTVGRALPWAMLVFIALRCALLLTLDNAEPRYTLEFFPPLTLGIAALLHLRARQGQGSGSSAAPLAHHS